MADLNIHSTVELSSLLFRLMDEYVAARQEPFKGHALHEAMRAIRARFEQAPSVEGRPDIRVKASLGMGNWAVVPWIAFLDQRDTSGTQRGVYVILLFRADMSGFYLTLNQGMTKPMETLGRSAARAALKRRAVGIRAHFPELKTLGFDTETALDMRASRDFTAGLDESTIAHQLFPRDELDGAKLMDSLEKILGVYERYLDAPIVLQ